MEALGDDALKAQVCETLNNMSTKSTAKAVVDTKLFYSGINAQWFFNFSIDGIKRFSEDILARMPSGAISDGVSNERAVNSALLTFWEDGRQIKLFTSRYLTLLLGQSEVHSTKFFELFPLMKKFLGNGGPGEVFEAYFLVNLEHCHDIAGAQRAVMGQQHAQQVDVRLGVDISNGKEVRWLTGKLSSLPKQQGDPLAAQPMPYRATDVTNCVPQWFVPQDNYQPFLDFFILIPAEDGRGWTLRVIQNTVSEKHSTDLTQLELVLRGIEIAGFSLALEVDVTFVIEDRGQVSLRKRINGSTIEVTLPSMGRPKRGDNGTSTTKVFKINVLHILFKRTGAAP